MLTGDKISPPPENVRVKTYETLNITLNNLSIVLQELLTAYQADLKLARVGGWVAGSPSDNKANLSSTRLKLDLTTWTELGNTVQILCKYFTNIVQILYIYFTNDLQTLRKY